MGKYETKRLIFGAKSSQNSFDEAMYRIFGDYVYCLNHRDDILVGGKTREHHNKNLERVLQRARDCGITLNKDKCEFEANSIEILWVQVYTR